MANPSIRGHKGQFKVFENGQPTNIVDLTSVDVSQDSSFMRTFYVGRPVPEGDQTVEGWSGSVECEVKDASIDEFIDALVTNNLNGIGVSDYTFTTTEEYGDGTQKSYVYFDVQWKMSKRQAGLNEKMTKRLEFQASGRVAI
jgi:hypothetical protein